MRRTILAFGTVLATAAYAGGDSGYHPGAPPPPQTVSLSYFCSSDSTDDRYFVTKPRFAYRGKPDGTLESKYSIAWTEYLRKTYGTRTVSYYPHCNLMVPDQIDAAYQNVTTAKESAHRKVVLVDWQYAGATTGQ